MRVKFLAQGNNGAFDGARLMTDRYPPITSQTRCATSPLTMAYVGVCGIQSQCLKYASFHCKTDNYLAPVTVRMSIPGLSDDNSSSQYGPNIPPLPIQYHATLHSSKSTPVFFNITYTQTLKVHLQQTNGMRLMLYLLIVYLL